MAEWDAEAEHFDEAADHGLREPTTRAAWAELLAAALPDPPARVADLGCGTGTLSVLLADLGHEVDFSPAMLEQARIKVAGREGLHFHHGDAAEPPLPEACFDVALSRHVLWALADPAAALARWATLLRPAGRLVLIEGLWHTGAGLSADAVLGMLGGLGWPAELTQLDDPALWGRAIADERYLIVARPATPQRLR